MKPEWKQFIDPKNAAKTLDRLEKFAADSESGGLKHLVKILRRCDDNSFITECGLVATVGEV